MQDGGGEDQGDREWRHRLAADVAPAHAQGTEEDAADRQHDAQDDAEFVDLADHRPAEVAVQGEIHDLRSAT